MTHPWHPTCLTGGTHHGLLPSLTGISTTTVPSTVQDDDDDEDEDDNDGVGKDAGGRAPEGTAKVATPPPMAPLLRLMNGEAQEQVIDQVISMSVVAAPCGCVKKRRWRVIGLIGRYSLVAPLDTPPFCTTRCLRQRPVFILLGLRL